MSYKKSVQYVIYLKLFLFLFRLKISYCYIPKKYTIVTQFV